MTTPNRDQRDAAAHEARAIVAALATDDTPAGHALPDSTPAHRAAVSMIVGETPAVCAHLAAAPDRWTVVFALGWRPGTVRCGMCAAVAMTSPDVGACDLCGQPAPATALVLVAGNVVASLSACTDCTDALAGPDNEEDDDA